MFEEGALRILKTLRFDIVNVRFKMKCKKKRRINQTMWEEDREPNLCRVLQIMIKFPYFFLQSIIQPNNIQLPYR